MTEKFGRFPAAFQLAFEGPQGRYVLAYTPDQDEGRLSVSGALPDMVWHADVVERTADGWRIGGLTRGSAGVWGDTYWFELKTGAAPAVSYLDGKGLVRVDRP